MARVMPGEYVHLWTINGETQYEGRSARVTVFHDGAMMVSVYEFDGRSCFYRFAAHLWVHAEQGELAAPPSGLAS